MCTEGWKFFMYDVPQQGQVDSIIVMNKNMSHTYDIRPFNFGMIVPELFRQFIRCLSNDLYAMDYGITCNLSLTKPSRVV